MSLKILISGAGIAGPAAALWLTRQGHTCTVIERFSDLRATGLQVDLRMQGIEVVKRMGIMNEVKARAVDELGSRLVDAEGREVTRFERVEADSNRKQSLTSEYEIMRPDLTRILVGATQTSAEYRYGISVERFEDDGVKVAVTFSDGTSGEYDLLIAADGQGSRIRKHILAHDPSLDYSRSLNLFIAYFTLPRREGDENMATFYHAPGRRVISTRWHSVDRGQAYLGTLSHGEELRQALNEGVESQKAAFAEIFRGAGWQTERILDGLANSDDFYAQEILQRKSKIWSKGRVVLLGDAGYAPSPITGMGTSLALVGAYVLAGELAKRPGDVPGALEAYDVTLRPLVTEVQQLMPGIPGLVMPSSRLGIWLLHVVMRVIRAVGMVEFGKKGGWKLPEYPELW